MCLRDAESGQNSIAGELLDDAAVIVTQWVTSSKNRVTRRRTTSGSAPVTSSVGRDHEHALRLLHP
jgi:hypothetical protein